MSLVRLEIKPIETNLIGENDFLYEEIPFYILDLPTGGHALRDSLEEVFGDPVLNEVYIEDYDLFWDIKKAKMGYGSQFQARCN